MGNVLVHIDPAAFLRSLSIDTPENRARYQSSIVEIVRRYERGDDTTAKYLSNLDVLFNSRDRAPDYHHGGKEYFSQFDFRNAMLSIIGAPVAGMEQIVRHVGARLPIGLLSNTNPIHFEYCLQKFPVLRHIPSHFLSYQLRAFKPEPEIFARVIEKIPLPPGEILYIDDLAENVDAARTAGLVGHQFIGVKNIQQVFSDLKLM
jgi:putative hydrolase of the HAD superfamily